MRHALGAAVICCGSLLTATANATLLPRDVSGVPGVTDAYYDTALNITWLRDANYAQTSGFASGGLMSFTTAQAWAASLNFGGITGWTLAGVAQPDASCSNQSATYGSTGINCTGGDLGYMFYVEMGGTEGVAISASHSATYGLFTNVEDGEYWSTTGLPLSDDARDLAYFFSEYNAPDGTPAGYVSLNFQTYGLLGWVVHSGDVGVAEPDTVALLGIGGAVLIAVRRRATKTRQY